MKVIETKIPGVLIIEPKVFGDDRGCFKETYSVARYQKQGVAEVFVQDNEARSQQHVLRGLHYQLKYPQGKLVSVMQGKVFDVAVDIRRGSPTFKRWVGVELSAENHQQFYVPPGFAHGYCVLSEEAIFTYKCTNYYHPEDEYSLRWDDPDIAIEWPLQAMPNLSEKDQQGRFMKDFLPDQLPELEV